MHRGTIEWAPFKLKPGVDEATLWQASEALQRDFLERQAGFVRRELLRGSNGQWVDLVYWESHSAVERAMAAVQASPVCQTYFHLMEAADPGQPDAGVQLYGIYAKSEA